MATKPEKPPKPNVRALLEKFEIKDKENVTYSSGLSNFKKPASESADKFENNDIEEVYASDDEPGQDEAYLHKSDRDGENNNDHRVTNEHHVDIIIDPPVDTQEANIDNVCLEKTSENNTSSSNISVSNENLSFLQEKRLKVTVGDDGCFAEFEEPETGDTSSIQHLCLVVPSEDPDYLNNATFKLCIKLCKELNITCSLKHLETEKEMLLSERELNNFEKKKKFSFANLFPRFKIKKSKSRDDLLSEDSASVTVDTENSERDNISSSSIKVQDVTTSESSDHKPVTATEEKSQSDFLRELKVKTAKSSLGRENKEEKPQSDKKSVSSVEDGKSVERFDRFRKKPVVKEQQVEVDVDDDDDGELYADVDDPNDDAFEPEPETPKSKNIFKGFIGRNKQNAEKAGSTENILEGEQNEQTQSKANRLKGKFLEGRSKKEEDKTCDKEEEDEDEGEMYADTEDPEDVPEPSEISGNKNISPSGKKDSDEDDGEEYADTEDFEICEQPSVAAKPKPVKPGTAQKQPPTSAQRPRQVPPARRPNLNRPNQQKPASAVSKPEVKPGAKTEQKPGAKTEQKPGAKTEQKPGAKTEQKPGAKTEQKPGAKTEQKPGAKTELKPGAKVEQKPGAVKPNQRVGAQKPGAASAQKPGAPGAQKPGAPGAQKPGGPREPTSGQQKPRAKPGDTPQSQKSKVVAKKPAESAAKTLMVPKQKLPSNESAEDDDGEMYTDTDVVDANQLAEQKNKSSPRPPPRVLSNKKEPPAKGGLRNLIGRKLPEPEPVKNAVVDDDDDDDGEMYADTEDPDVEEEEQKPGATESNKAAGSLEDEDDDDDGEMYADTDDPVPAPVARSESDKKSAAESLLNQLKTKKTPKLSPRDKDSKDRNQQEESKNADSTEQSGKAVDRKPVKSSPKASAVSTPDPTVSDDDGPDEIYDEDDGDDEQARKAKAAVEASKKKQEELVKKQQAKAEKEKKKKEEKEAKEKAKREEKEKREEEAREKEAKEKAKAKKGKPEKVKMPSKAEKKLFKWTDEEICLGELQAQTDYVSQSDGELSLKLNDKVEIWREEGTDSGGKLLARRCKDGEWGFVYEGFLKGNKEFLTLEDVYDE